MPSEQKKERLNIYLMKLGVTLDQAIDPGAHGLELIPLLTELPFQGKAFIKRSHPHPPPWLDFVQSGMRVPIANLNVRGAACLILLTAADRIFAICYGSSRHCIVDGHIERRFGMIVTLNCVDPDLVRSIDREEFDTITRTTRSQTSVSAPLENFGLDVQRDLVRSVTGKPADETFASHVTGADNLILSVAITFDKLADKCEQAFAIYNMTIYKERYPWVDNFIRVRDPELVNELDELLVSRLGEAEPQDIYLSPPTMLDTQEHLGYRFPRQRKGYFDDLRLNDFLGTIRPKFVTIEHEGLDVARPTVENLHQWKIRRYKSDDKSNFDSFSVYDAIVFEVSRANKLFTLTRGEWFEIDQAYVSQVDSAVATIVEHPALHLPDAVKGEHEGVYNSRASASSEGDLALLDAKPISYGGGRSKMEVCDLLSHQRNFIHVKSKTKSAALSHLFAQGLNSAQAFRDKEYRTKALDVCPETHHHIFTGETIDPALHSVTYAVITSATNGLHDALPFFSRQSLANAARELRNMGYSVYLKKISIAQVQSNGAEAD